MIYPTKWFRRLGVLALFTVLPACSSSRTPASADYTTLPHEPQRDLSTAAKDNDEACTLISHGDYSAAETILKRALASDVMYGPAHNNLGLVYFQQSKMYLAAWEFQYAIKLMPSDPRARNNLGLIFENTGKLDKAVESYDAAMQQEPDNPEFVGNLARARLRRRDSGQEVSQLLQKVASFDTRPEWSTWAREQLVLMNRPRFPEPSGQP